MRTFLHFHSNIRPFFITTMFLGALVLLTSSVLAVIRNRFRTDTNIAGQPLYEYSFIGEDYPMYYPLNIRDVLLIPEDTVHYGITGPDADEEWKSVFPPGQGFVWLGRERRIFGLALYHQMHCLDRIRGAIGKKRYNQHVHHCFNYLRQAILCEADTTIESGVPSLGRRVVRSSVQRTCKDWTQIYKAAEEGYYSLA